MSASNKRYLAGLIALAIACLAFLTAALPTWVLPVVSPPPTVEKQVVDTMQGIKDRVAAKVQGVEYKEPRSTADWQRILNAAAVTLGALALVLAAVSFAMKEPWRLGATAAFLGSAAILLQFSLMVVYAVLAILLISVILSALDLGF